MTRRGATAPAHRASKRAIHCFQQSNARSLARLVLVSLFLLALSDTRADTPPLPPAAKKQVNFFRDIRPILDAQCMQCHGKEKQRGGLRLDDRDAALRGGENYAPAIKPGDSTNSPLIRFVAGQVPDMLMPPKGKPLSAEEIGLLRAWVEQGAVWPVDERNPKETHWSLNPLTRPPLPQVEGGGSGNPIDAFIYARLREKELSPSPETDRRTLIRRLYFDLVGLPPPPEEVKAFVANKSPRAYESLVETLLNSPRYGERWARHWLDIVRFAETTGFEVNTPRPNAWPYRDYVIRSFNEDKPYDQFVREQIAGDLLGEDSATGFIVAGPEDLVKSPDPVLTSNQRADELHDMVSTTASAFLGLTVGCARCHNHKFDPIPQTDYYAMKAVFEGVRHGERRIKTADAEARQLELAQSREKLAKIDSKLSEFEPLAQTVNIDTNRLRAMVNARKNIERFAAVTARKLRFSITKTSGAEPCIDELEIYTAGEKSRNVALASLGTKASSSSVFPNSDIHRLEHVNDGKHGNSRSWISNERGKGWVELEFSEPVTIDRIVWSRDREQKFVDRLATEYEILVFPASAPRTDSRSLLNREKGEPTSLDETDDAAWVKIASSTDRRPFKSNTHEEHSFSLAGLYPGAAALVKQLAADRKVLEARIAELSRQALVYAGTFAETPGTTFRLHRGDPMQKREPVNPGALSAVPVKFIEKVNTSTANQPKMTDEQRRRIALAAWITDSGNPLTARVMANRLWQYHFGEGIVSTPSDLGVNGARPTHPELLDWLAVEFREGGKGGRAWSIKHLHRLIVTSATYKQSSNPRPEGLQVDVNSSLLWRFPPRRLDAEPIRDMILAITGKLDLTMGGPGFSFFEPNDNYVRVYAPKNEFGAETFRRMVYGMVVRQRPDGVFGVFDCPDGGQIAPKRTRSTTPLQALNLLNSRFMMQQVSFLAERLRMESGENETAQIRHAFALAFQRQPDAVELEASIKLIRKQGLQVFCRALLNANELVYVF